MAESKIEIKVAEDGPSEVQILRNQEQSIICRHSAKHPWNHLLTVVEFSVPEIQKDFLEYCSLLMLPQTVAYEPFKIAVSLWRNGECMAEKKDSLVFQSPDKAEDISLKLLARTPKLFWGLKKTFNNKKCDSLMIAFEWLVTTQSAPAKEIKKLIAAKMATD